MFSKSCEYAIRACAVLHDFSSQGKLIKIKELSELTDTPESYLAKVMQILSKSQIALSHKGPGGGFYLDLEKNLKLMDIVVAIDGHQLFTGCGLGLKQCSEKNPCILHNHFKDVRNTIKGMLKNTSLELLAQSISDGTCRARNFNELLESTNL